MTSVDKVLNEREKTHGSFEVHAFVTQQLKAVINHQLADMDRRLANDMRESLDMICHKIGRIVAGDPNHHDHWLDIAGYATLVADRLENDTPLR